VHTLSKQIDGNWRCAAAAAGGTMTCSSSFTVDLSCLLRACKESEREISISMQGSTNEKLKQVLVGDD
jgi:hypothetical protein